MFNIFPSLKYVRYFALIIVFLSFYLVATIRLQANIPGGGNGSGPAVGIIYNNNANPPTVTLSNGIVSVVIDTYSSQILQLFYNGNQLTDGGSAMYWQGQGHTGEQTGTHGVLSVIVNPATNGGAFAEICIANLYTNQRFARCLFGGCRYYYFSMFRGSPGIYVTEDMERDKNAVAGGADIPQFDLLTFWGNFN